VCERATAAPFFLGAIVAVVTPLIGCRRSESTPGNADGGAATAAFTPTPTPAPTPDGGAGRPPDRLVEHRATPHALTVRDEVVYWVEDVEQGGVFAASTGGGVRTLAELQRRPRAIAVDEAFVYWTSWHHEAGSIRRVRQSGGAIDELATNRRGPEFLMTDGASLYWIDAGTGISGDVVAMPKIGGQPRTLASAEAEAHHLAMDDGRLYWASYDRPKGDTVLRSAPTAGGLPATVARIHGTINGLTAHGDSLYLTTPRAILSVPRAGGSATTLSTDEADPRSIAVSRGMLYWINFGTRFFEQYHRDGSIVAMPSGGGARVVLAQPLDYPLSLAVTADAAYASAGLVDGAILRVPLH